MEYILVLILILLFSTLNMLPVLLSAFTVPQGSIFIGIPHWYEDYFFYLSLIKQGVIGQWQALNWFTTEPIPPYPGYWCYLLLGHIGAVIHLNPWVIYNIALFLSSIVYLSLIYGFIRHIFPKQPFQRIVGFIIAVSATAFFRISYASQTVVITPYSFYFTPTLALNRLGGTIHQLWTNILVVIYIFVSYPLLDNLLSKPVSELSKKRILLIMGIHVLLFSLNPAAAAMVLTSFGITGLLLIMNKRHWSSLSILIGIIVLLSVISIPFLLQYIDASKHPLYQYILLSFSKTFERVTPDAFFLATGAISIFALFGFFPWIKEKTSLSVFGAVFVLFPILLYLSPIPGLCNLPYERILQPASYIFLGPIAALGLIIIAAYLHRVTHIKKIILIAGFLTVFLLLQGVVVGKEVESRFRGLQEAYFLNTIPKELYDGLKYLEKEPSGIIFAPYNSSLLAPAISGKPVYAAHRLLTIQFMKKFKEVNDFFSLRWNEKEAQTFFMKNHIRYVIFPGSKESQNSVQSLYPFFTPLWSNQAFTIYRAGN
jgi:hypothetical protein